MDTVIASLSGILLFAIYFIASVAVVLVFMKLYTTLTPHDEVTLIKENNAVAAVTYTGAMLGFALPIASVIANSVGIIDFVIWAVVAGIVQIIAFFGFRAFYPRVSERIREGEIAVGIHLAGFSVTVGLLNAASMTY